MGNRNEKSPEIPFLVKAVAIICVVLLLNPLMIFTAMPNMFFGFGSSETEEITRMTEQAMTIGGIYTSLEDFDGTQVDSIVTSIASEYEQNGLISRYPAALRKRIFCGSSQSTPWPTNKTWMP